MEVSCGYQSQPLALCSNSFGSPIFLKCKCSQTHWHNYQAICFPNLNISIKHRQIGGQSVRFALHERFSIAVGCRFAWHRIRWFQQSRDSLKGSGSGNVCQVSVGPTRASPLDRPIVGLSKCSLSADNITDLIQMRLNISMAKDSKDLWKCLVSEACSSLAWSLQPRWVVEAPAQDQSLRLTKGKLPEQNCQREVNDLNFVSQTYTALSGIPRNNSFGKRLPRVVSSLVFGFFRVITVMYFTSICF